MAFCSNCGKELSEGAKFCDGCGAKVGNIISENENNKINNLNIDNYEKKPKKKKSIFKIILSIILIPIALVIFIIIASILYVAFFSDDNEYVNSIKIGGIEFSLNDKYYIEENEDKGTVYFNKKEDEMIVLIDLGISVSKDQFRETSEKYINSNANAYSYKEFNISSDIVETEINSIPCSYVNVTGKTNGDNELNGVILSYYVENTNDVILITYLEIDKNDFDKISTFINSAKLTDYSSKSSINSDYSSYSEIYDEYSYKIRQETPKLIEEYQIEASSNNDGIEGLAELSNSKVEKLAEISTEGTEKMAEYMYSHGSGSTDEYMKWAEKLTSVYMEESQKITNEYLKSAM